jgi:hypothetical protein
MKWTNDYIAKPFVPLRFHFSLKGALLMAKLSLFIHLSPSLFTAYQELGRHGSPRSFAQARF